MMILKLMKIEVQLWLSLYAWIRRRPYGPDDFPYHARSQVALHVGVAVLTTPLAIAMLELLIPWPWLRLSALVMTLYAFLWILMRFASLRSMPHRLESGGLRLRYGALAGAFIPYERIAEAQVAMAKAPTQGDGVMIDKEAAYLAIGGETNLRLRLNEPLALSKVLGDTPPVREIHFATDEPKRMIERLAARLKPPEAVASLSTQT